jgi:hypothetical protein
MADREVNIDSFLMECATRLKKTGTPPPLFREFLALFRANFNLDNILTNTNIKFSVTQNQSNFHFYFDQELNNILVVDLLHYAGIEYDSDDSSGEYETEFTPKVEVSGINFKIVVNSYPLLNEILVHLTCFLSNFLNYPAVNTLHLENHPMIHIPHKKARKLLLKILNPTIHTKNLIYNLFYYGNENISQALCVKYFTTIKINLHDLYLISNTENRTNFTSLEKLIINNYLQIDHLEQLLNLDILYLRFRIIKRDIDSFREKLDSMEFREEHFIVDLEFIENIDHFLVKIGFDQWLKKDIGIKY